MRSNETVEKLILEECRSLGLSVLTRIHSKRQVVPVQ
jgi:hypothetical protein